MEIKKSNKEETGPRQRSVHSGWVISRLMKGEIRGQDTWDRSYQADVKLEIKELSLSGDPKQTHCGETRYGPLREICHSNPLTSRVNKGYRVPCDRKLWIIGPRTYGKKVSETSTKTSSTKVRGWPSRLDSAHSLVLTLVSHQ